MLERFAHDSRRAVARAVDTARRLGAEQVEPEHLLLALATAGGDDRAGPAIASTATEPAARTLVEAGLDGAQIERAIELDLVAALQTVGVPASVVAATPIHPRADTPRFGVPAKQVLEGALRAAADRGARQIGTEHLLLGLLRPPPVGVARVLARLDVAPDRLAALVQVEMAAGR